MKEIDYIKQPVSEAFEEFEKVFAQALSSEVKSICAAIDAIRRSSGKHIRPLLLLLSASACGKVSPCAVQSAVLLELLHTASLIHDDVVDDTRQRRGTPSLNNVHGNAVAVLVGDFILSVMMIRALETVDKQIVKMIAELSRDMVEGEIKQLDNTGEMILSENEYFAVLEKKTAGLLSSCTEIGAVTAGASYEMQVKCRTFGYLMGLCFQIKDDIFDYFDNGNTGKPNGNDIRDGKVTLPLLYALESSAVEEKAPYIQMLREKRFTPENIAALIRFAKDRGGIEYAESRMTEYKSKAVEIISTLPGSGAKNSLLRLADYIVERTK
ncbi:MAG: polyprenyl synthetase family protein [Tannerella sp.]|jgi:octaprenyl-diphosphate synthase|nr:polyprenyl synthetase family protein [Tannerella sp.]